MRPNPVIVIVIPESEPPQAKRADGAFWSQTDTDCQPIAAFASGAVRKRIRIELNARPMVQTKALSQSSPELTSLEGNGQPSATVSPTKVIRD